MAPNIDLRQVQKQGGRIHLTVPGTDDSPVRTLCNKLFQPGDYRQVDIEADCQLCRKHRRDPALVSSAFFESAMGSRLLEMSLEQAKVQHTRRRTDRRAAPSLGRSARSARGGAKPSPSLKLVPAPKSEPEATAARPAGLAELGLAHMRQVSENLYRSDGGVLVRTRKRGGDLEIAEVVFDGAVQVRPNPELGIGIRLGDVIVEYTSSDGRIRTHPRTDSSA